MEPFKGCMVRKSLYFSHVDRDSMDEYMDLFQMLKKDKYVIKTFTLKSVYLNFS